MERAVAVKRLAKMLGRGFAYQINRDAPSPEEREEARAQLKGLVERRDAVSNALEARRKFLLAQDAEYQRLLAEWSEARKAAEQASGKLHHFKISVGTANKLFFHVEASGDSWEEIFEKLKGSAG